MIRAGDSIENPVTGERLVFRQTSRETGGGAAFRSDFTVDRTYEVVDPSVVSVAWIPKGRDHALEQKLLRKIRTKMQE